MAQPHTGDSAETEPEPIDTEEQLALADVEERLPWLESDDDYEPEGASSARIVAFAAIGLLAVALLVGMLWWFMRDRPDGEMLADGGVIEAPDEPYRTAPAERGGIQVQGTGDTSFAVAEGRAVDSRIAGSGVVPAPSIDRGANDRESTQGQSIGARGKASPGGAPAAEPSTPAPGVGVQVGAYSSRAAAEAGWSQLSGRIQALQGRSHRVVQGVADSGTIYRLQALAETGGEAETLCRAIKSQGGDCQVKR